MIPRYAKLYTPCDVLVYVSAKTFRLALEYDVAARLASSYVHPFTFGARSAHAGVFCTTLTKFEN